MKKGLLRYISITLFLYLALVAGAETVSQREAKRIAVKFFNAAYGQVMAEPRYVYNGKRLTTDRLFSPFYVYNCPAGGFVVISAENKAFPVLGYSLTDTFNPDNIGEATTALLKLYASHIENIRYDASVPHEAISAWQNIPEYINDILTANHQDDQESVYSIEEAGDMLRHIAETDAASSSDVYSSGQWADLIGDELARRKAVPLGIISNKGMIPLIINGRKGDYFQFSLDGANNQLWRLLPTEIISSGELAVLDNIPVHEEIIEEEEKPFAFYDSFIAETQKAYEADRASIENAQVIAEPIVSWQGLGHYTVTLPEEIESVRVYSLDGTQVYADKFRETHVAHLSLFELPTGFYFAVIFGHSGLPYSIKLFR